MAEKSQDFEKFPFVIPGIFLKIINNLTKFEDSKITHSKVVDGDSGDFRTGDRNSSSFYFVRRRQSQELQNTYGLRSTTQCGRTLRSLSETSIGLRESSKKQ